MFMHKNMYELIISDMKSREEITGKFETWADEFIQKAKADLSTLDKVNKMSYWMMLVDVHFEENKFVRFFGEDVPMNSLLKKIVHTEDEHLKNRMVEMVILHHGMETIRKMWHPMNGRGRQEKEYYLLKKISEAIIKKEEQVKKGWLEKNVLSEGQNEDDITKTFLWYI